MAAHSKQPTATSNAAKWFYETTTTMKALVHLADDPNLRVQVNAAELTQPREISKLMLTLTKKMKDDGRFSGRKIQTFVDALASGNTLLTQP